MGSELLDNAKDRDFGSIRAYADPCEQLWIKGFEFADELCSLMLKLRNGFVSFPRCVRAGLWPCPDIDGLENGPILGQDATNTQTIEFRIAIQCVPEMLQKMGVVVPWLTQQRLTRKAGERATQKDRHLGQLPEEAEVELLLHKEANELGT